MVFSLSVYNKRKEQLERKADKIRQVFIDREDELMVTQINDLLNRLNQDKFMITIIGEFSKGKSTFLNSLFGKRLLPAKVTPTTALLNKIIYQEEQKIIVRENGVERSISEEDFKKLIAPKEPISSDKKSLEAYQSNVEALNKIDLVTIGYPLPFLKNGVCIYDTPGFNDLDENRSQLTNTIIPQSDVVIFMLNARRQLSLSEHSFLENRVLTQDLGKIFFVINFKDQLSSESEVQRVRQELLRHLPPKIKHPKIFFVSAKHALNFRREQNGEIIKSPQWSMAKSGFVSSIHDTGIPEFEEELSQFLEDERGNIKLFRANVQLSHWIERVINQEIPLEVLSYNKRIVDAKYKKAELKNKLDNARAKQERLMKSIKKDGDEFFKKVEELYKKGQVEISKTVHNELKNQDGDYKAIAEAIEVKIAPLEGKLNQKVMQMAEIWKNHALEQCSKHLSNTLEHNFQDIVDSLIIHNDIADDNVLSLDKLADTFYSSIMDLAPREGSLFFTSLATAGRAIIKFFGRVIPRKDNQATFKERIRDRFEKINGEKLVQSRKQWQFMQNQLLDHLKIGMEKELQRTELLFLKMLNNAEQNQVQADIEIQLLQAQKQKLEECLALTY